MASPDLEKIILELLEKREPGKTICPSEAARVAFPERWRQQMGSVREAADNLSRRKEIEILQGGEIVDPQTVRGPIRLKRTK